MFVSAAVTVAAPVTAVTVDAVIVIVFAVVIVAAAGAVVIVIVGSICNCELQFFPANADEDLAVQHEVR